MTELRFPKIPSPTWPFTEESEDTSLKSQFEDGSLQTRSKFTRSRRKWTLKWNTLPRKDYIRLMKFIREEAKFSANSFLWKNPDTFDPVYQEYSPDPMEEIEVRITAVGKWKNENLNYWGGEIELTEV